MSIFTSTLNQMLFLFICILIGYFIQKSGQLPQQASSVISKLENFIIIPALLIKSFSANCSLVNLVNNLNLIVYGLIFTVLQVGIAYALTPLFKPRKQDKGIYLYSLSVVNFAFMGNSLILSLFGSEMLFRYLMFSLPLNILVFSLGVIWLTAGSEKFTIRKLANPTMISMLIGMVIGVTGLQLPQFVTSTIDGFAGCFSPLAMLLTGIVIGQYDVRKLVTNKQIYLLTAIRCIILPLIILYTVKLIGLDPSIITLLIFITAMPLGLNTIVFPAAYGGDTTLGASMAVISNVLGLITVPVMLMLFL